MTDLFYADQEVEVHDGTGWRRAVVKSRTWLVLTVETRRHGVVSIQRRHVARRVRVPKLTLCVPVARAS